MTATPIYLVSACASAEEFVAAFRRYADRIGLFIPMAEPLPANKIGRLAVTLSDGSVMIEGLAQIVSSSAKPAGLYGRAGMTVKFVTPEGDSKLVLEELAKARLALKPTPPSVTPRKADVPAGPRATPPEVGGRIDAANALAESVAIGDAGGLRQMEPSSASATGAMAPLKVSPPAAAGGASSSGALPRAGQKFVVPSIRPGGDSSGAPEEPNKSGESEKSPLTKSHKPTMLGIPVVGASKLPGAPDKPLPRVESGPAKRPTLSIPPLKVAQQTTPAAPDHEPPSVTKARLEGVKAGVPKRSNTPSVPPMPRQATPFAPLPIVKLGATTQMAPPPPPPGLTAQMPAPPAAMTGAIPAAPAPETAAKSGGVTAPMPPAKSGGVPAPMPPAKSGGVPAPMPPTKSGGVPLAPSRSGSLIPTPPQPLPYAPVSAPVPSALAGVELPTEPTEITIAPPAPSTPTPVPAAPVIAAPAAAKHGRRRPPTEDDELVEAPTATAEAIDIAERIAADRVASEKAASEPTMSAAAEATLKAVDESTRPSRSGGMRASEIMAAIPSEDWTMTPDAVAPSVLTPEEKAVAASVAAANEATTPSAPLEIPSSPSAPTAAVPPLEIAATTSAKGPPTGDWTMTADPSQPDGWGSPSKLNKQIRPPELPAKPASGNPVHAVSGSRSIDVPNAWEDKPTGIGEPLVEIDSTLMERVSAEVIAHSNQSSTAPLPTIPFGPGQSQAGFPDTFTPPPLAPPPIGPTPYGGAPLASSPSGPHGYPSEISQPQAFPITFPPPSGPPVAMSGSHAMPMDPHAYDPNAQAQMMGFAAPYADGGQFTDAQLVLAKKKRNRVIAVSLLAIAAAITAIVVVLVTGGGKKSSPPDKGSAHAVVAPGSAAPAVGSPESPGSAAVATAPGSAATEPAPGSATAATPPPAPTGDATCTVEVTSTPAGAQVMLDKTALGTTPGKFQLPCGAEAKLKIFKQRYFGIVKSVTPRTEGTKLDLQLNQAIFTIKVTSTPSGAYITLGGKAAGVTPSSVKLPAYEASTIGITKDGYAPDSQKITPRQNGTNHHVVLKKLAGGAHR